MLSDANILICYMRKTELRVQSCDMKKIAKCLRFGGEKSTVRKLDLRSGGRGLRGSPEGRSPEMHRSFEGPEERPGWPDPATLRPGGARTRRGRRWRGCRRRRLRRRGGEQLRPARAAQLPVGDAMAAKGGIGQSAGGTGRWKEARGAAREAAREGRPRARAGRGCGGRRVPRGGALLARGGGGSFVRPDRTCPTRRMCGELGLGCE